MAAIERIWATADPFLEDGAVLGRKEANRDFLLALLRADPYDAYHFFLDEGRDPDALRGRLHELCPHQAGRGSLFFHSFRELPQLTAQTRLHCLHLSDAVSRFVPVCELRNLYSRHIFPVTSITHSLSYARFMPEYLRHLRPGLCARDVIIATSRSAESVLARVFAGLRSAYGLDEKNFPAPKIARIPLGVECGRLPDPNERWDAPIDGANRGRTMRERLRIGNSVAFLCLSRFSPYSKMDLLPLFAAFKRAESLGLLQTPSFDLSPASSLGASGGPVLGQPVSSEGAVLILAGFAEPGDKLPESLQSYAQSLGIATRLFLRPSEEEKFALYAAADVFVSPADNLQETFGLTLAEAGAAGLPVIAPDFDGYRDIAVHEETALLIPVLGFAESVESDTQSLYLYDNQYHLKLAQETALDVPALAAALARLGRDAALRRGMGEAGRRRVAEHFSWDKVIERMTGLWDELNAISLPPGERERLRAARHPLQPRYAEYFSGHFSEVLDEQVIAGMRLKRTAAGAALYRGALPLVPYAGMEFFLDAQAVRLMLVAARRETGAAEVLKSLRVYFACAGLSEEVARERASFTLLWALKQDYLERSARV